MSGSPPEAGNLRQAHSRSSWLRPQTDQSPRYAGSVAAEVLSST